MNIYPDIAIYNAFMSAGNAIASLKIAQRGLEWDDDKQADLDEAIRLLEEAQDLLEGER